VAYLRRSAVFPVALVLVGCVACGSSTSSPAVAPSTAAPTSSAAAKAEAALTADQVPAAVKAAGGAAGAVHIKGSITQGADTVKFDVQLNKDSAGGTVTKAGADIPVRRVGEKYYIQCTSSVLKLSGVSVTTKPGSLMRDKWVSSDSKLAAGMAASFKDLLDYDTVLSNVAAPTGTLTAAGSDTVNGTPVLIFRDGDGSSADVAASSPHYIIRVVGPESNLGSVDFTGWGQTDPVVAPKAAEIYSGPGA
jgi:hypothetical protein